MKEKSTTEELQEIRSRISEKILEGMPAYDAYKSEAGEFFAEIEEENEE